MSVFSGFAKWKNNTNPINLVLDVFIGKIRYIDYSDFPLPQNLSSISMIYQWYFYKRVPFVYELEFRAIIDAYPYIKKYFDSHGGTIDAQTILNSELPDICEFGMPIKVDVNMLVSEVIISPYADDWITETVESVVRQYGYKFPVSRSKLLDPPD